MTTTTTTPPPMTEFEPHGRPYRARAAGKTEPASVRTEITVQSAMADGTIRAARAPRFLPSEARAAAGRRTEELWRCDSCSLAAAAFSEQVGEVTLL
jgi:hypothetical protein